MLVVKRTSLNLELELVAEARKVLGTKGTTDTIHRALEDVVRREKLRALAGETFDDLTPAALEDVDNLPPPEVIAQEIVEDLEAALAEFSAIAQSLGRSEPA